ncbi:MAG TPA: hypothetical protein VM870_05835 [Pyrinomonadaceae bacterium]|nr:hypothetical protein [Pyrinomonadaceae bacterium]
MQARARPKPIQLRMKALSRLGVSLIIYSASLALAAEEPGEHEREELGVNPYTAPSVAEIFQQLDDLRPLPFEELRRDFPQGTHAGREQMGMVFGGLVADGFLIVESKRQNLVEDLGRVLLRQARSLGVGDRVMRHSASLTELGKKGDWAAVRAELLSTQEDVEQAMTELRDQKMAHLISLGGWLRGLEICAGAVEGNYTTDRAAVLWQRDLINYFAEELGTLPPAVAHKPFFENVRAGVNSLRDLLNRVPDKIPLEDVKALHAQAKELNRVIAAAD